MKKAKRILLVLMSAVLMIECCGCGIFISERKLKKCIENALEEKYDEAMDSDAKRTIMSICGMYK